MNRLHGQEENRRGNMKTTPRAIWLLIACLVLCIAAPAAGNSQDVPRVTYDVAHDVSLPLREMAQFAAPIESRGVEVREQVRRMHLPPGGKDGAVQDRYVPKVSTTQVIAFDGITGNQAMVVPPDTNGSVGSTQFVEITNWVYEVFDKATGKILLPPTRYQTIWHGFRQGCGENDNGDPIVLWDKLAQRWLVSHLSFTSFTQHYLVCVAVSTTADATGSYSRYSFDFGSGNPDYEKLAVWPDAYYFSANTITPKFEFTSQPCAFDREAMLSGARAKIICFPPDPKNFSLLPSDFDGTNLPPTGEPDHYVELGKTANLLNEFDFHVDFAQPRNSTFTGPHSIPVPSFTLACGGNFCIPEPPPGSLLDSLGDRLMYRLAYRNFGDHESMVVVHSVKPGKGSSALAATRWYELRATPPGSAFVLYQAGTFQDPKTNLWMASTAMDKQGDIAMGMSASSKSLMPSVWYTGRVPSDPLGKMEVPTVAVKGTAVQSSTVRWGDYSSMSVDPSDDCTFWYAQEYYNKKNGGAVSEDWSTHIVAFKFDNCK
jgi:hypothetical protein